ncbi:MAG: hypothetical protein PHS84_11915 [Paludibacter sp.]|nr:hypothetical protein [Paludibacter sp.]
MIIRKVCRVLNDFNEVILTFFPIAIGNRSYGALCFVEINILPPDSYRESLLRSSGNAPLGATLW